MPNGFLSKTLAEVALDLVTRYLEFARDDEREKYHDADSYLRLYEKAYRLIMEVTESEKGKPAAGFKS